MGLQADGQPLLSDLQRIFSFALLPAEQRLGRALGRLRRARDSAVARAHLLRARAHRRTGRLFGEALGRLYGRARVPAARAPHGGADAHARLHHRRRLAPVEPDDGLHTLRPLPRSALRRPARRRRRETLRRRRAGRRARVVCRVTLEEGV